jgi:hypothetical protein
MFQIASYKQPIEEIFKIKLEPRKWPYWKSPWIWSLLQFRTLANDHWSRDPTAYHAVHPLVVVEDLPQPLPPHDMVIACY